MPDAAAFDNQQADLPDLSNSGCQTPMQDLWFTPAEENPNFYELPDIGTHGDLGFTEMESTSSGMQLLEDSLQQSQVNIGTQFDISMSNLACVDHLETWDIYRTPTSQHWTGPGALISHNSSEALGQTLPVLASAEDSAKDTRVSVACTCLQQNAALLSNPSIAEMNACDSSDDAHLTLDKALSLARQGIRVWRSLIACPRCPYKGDQEVVMLAYMGIRSVTRYLQRLGPRYVARLRKDAAAPSMNTEKETVRLMVGTLEVGGDERVSVFRLLFQKTLQNVRQTLHALQKIQSRRKGQLLQGISGHAAGADDYQVSSSLLHIQQISHALASSLQELESAVGNVQ